MDTSEQSFRKESLNHAWNWFALHAGQRMQSFNYFLLATAFLFAAYGTLLEKHAYASAAIGILGAWISLWFNRMERRTKQLIKAGEAALFPLQQQLAKDTAIEALAILQEVEAKASGSASYSCVIDTIQRTILGGFLAGAVYAGLRAIASSELRQAGGFSMVWFSLLSVCFGIVGSLLLAFAIVPAPSGYGMQMEGRFHRLGIVPSVRRWRLGVACVVIAFLLQIPGVLGGLR